jgi:hypothetical protein
MKMAKPPRNNLTSNQRAAIKEIKNDTTVSIYPFDKGTGFVRIDKSDALQKIEEQLGTAKILEIDPTKTIATSIRSELCKLNKKKKFTKNEYENIYPSDAIPPRMYGAIKAHKPQKNYPMRIIVSTVGTATHGISEYLVKLTQPILNKNKSRLRNSTDFVNDAKTWNISPTEVQVSYDVVNLYPSVPLDEATTVILEMLSRDEDLNMRTKLNINEIKILIELCLKKCYFLWNEHIYELENSGPIGLSFMVVLAESFLQHNETKALNSLLVMIPPVNVKSFYRYVDDSHARFDAITDASKFQHVLNQQHPSIQYTIEHENENKELNFLDVTVKNNGTGQYEFKVHRKEAITNIQIKPTSDHDPKVIDGVFKGFVHRALTICSKKHLQSELQFLVDTFVENGYARVHLLKLVNQVQNKFDSGNGDSACEVVQREETHDQNDDTHDRDGRNDDNACEVVTRDDTHDRDGKNGDNVHKMQTISLPWVPGLSPKLRKIYRSAGYKAVFKSGANLKNILTSRNKTQLPPHSHPGVYLHESTCSRKYVGQTKKQINTRMDEHAQNIEKKRWTEPMAQHVCTCGCNIDWTKVKTLKISNHKFGRQVREALEIQYHQCGPRDGGMNLDDGRYLKTLFWTPMLKSLREKKNL